MRTHPELSLVTHFQALPDPRTQREPEHKLIDILVIAICTQLCGGEGFNDMEEFGEAKHDWFKTFLELPNGIPSHDTFNRVFRALDPASFLDGFVRWTQSLRVAVSEEIVALDGKALRRALAAGQSAPVLVSAWARENGLVLGQLQVRDKSNEITAVPELLRALELAGCIVTLDAMGCQKNIAKEIKEADAEYVLALKGNHALVHEEVQSYLDDAIARGAKELVRHETVEKDHGRLETRTYWQSAELGWFADRAQWEGLQSVGVVEARRQVGDGPATVERRYYLSSLGLDAARFARAVRGHWSVENQCHWLLDVQMGEDQSRARAGHAAQNLGTLRRLALNLLKREATKKRGIKGKQKSAGWDHSYLLKLLGVEI
jgi:predicted transposase YbfD/YdcC